MEIIVDPLKPETWKNHPAPPVPDYFKEELERMGGFNRYGEPNLQLHWGQSYEEFRLGKVGLLYRDGQIPAVKHERRYLVKQIGEEVKRESFVNFQTGQIEIKETKIPVLAKEPIRDKPQVIPAGWFYLEDKPEYELIGKPCWFIAHWASPETLGPKEVWEMNRFDWYYDEEQEGDSNFTLDQEVWMDFLGPFPSRGRHESFLIVTEKYLYPKKVETVIYEEDEKGELHAVDVKTEMIPTMRDGYKDLEEHGRLILADLARRMYNLRNNPKSVQQQLKEQNEKRRDAIAKRQKTLREDRAKQLQPFIHAATLNKGWTSKDSKQYLGKLHSEMPIDRHRA